MQDDAPPAARLVGVQYVGAKPVKADNVAMTGLSWLPAQILNLPLEQAEVYARYPDVWAIVDPVEGQPAAIVRAPEPEEVEREMPLLPNLKIMDKQALIQYAQRELGETLDPKARAVDMASRIHSLVASGRAADR